MNRSPRDPYDTLASIFLGTDADRAPSGDGPVAGTAAAGSNGGSSADIRSSSLSLAEADGRNAAMHRQGDDRAARVDRCERADRSGRANRADRTDHSGRISGGGLVRVTAAVTGHLPVMAGLWATQFADRVGTSDGPTGLIRCERELVQVEILRGGGRHIGLRQGESLESWLRRAARVVRRWVLCLPLDEDPATVLDPGFADATLLTSADEAAVAAARSVIESIGVAAARLGTTRSLGVIVCGAPPERARWLADQLAAQALQGVDVPLAGSIQRMDRVESSERYGFEAPEAPRAADLLRLLESAASDAVERLHGEGVDMDRLPPRRPAAPSRSDPQPAGPHADAPFAGALEPALPESVAPVIPGLIPLGMRCPVVSEVELACDSEGRLHLVTSLERMTALAGARRWAEVNAPLLARAFPALRGFGERSEPAQGSSPPVGPAPRREIVERVVTLDATLVETLHGGGLALDLLVPLRMVAGVPQQGLARSGTTAVHWHHVPLNAAARPRSVGQ